MIDSVFFSDLSFKEVVKDALRGAVIIFKQFQKGGGSQFVLFFCLLSQNFLLNKPIL